MPNVRFSGMTAFWVVLLGHFISLMGTTTTQFGLKIWAYTETGSATIDGVVGLLLSLSLWFVPMVRNVEDLFLDHRATQGLSAP